MAEEADTRSLDVKIKALEAELDKYRLLVDNIQDILYRTDLEGRVVYISPTVSSLMGYTVDEARGKSMAQDGYLVPEEREEFLNILRENGQVTNFRARMKRKDGSVWWALTNAHYFYDEAGAVQGVEGITRDISRLVAAEQALTDEVAFQRIIGEIANSFIDMPTSRIDRGIERALASIGEFVDADRCHLVLFDRPTGMLSNTHEWCREGISPQIQRLKNVPMELFDWFVEPLSRLRHVQIPRVADLPEEARGTKAELEAEEIQSILIVPLAAEGKYAGSIGFDFVRQEKTCSESEILLLETAGATISNALNRRRAEAALRESEERMKAVFEAIPDPVVVYDTQGHPQFLNPAFTECFGWSLAEIFGRRIPFVPEDLKEQTLEKLNALVATGRPVRFLSRRLTKTGNEIEVMISAAAIKDAGNHFVGMVVHLTDISMQRDLEAQLRQAQKMESVGRLAGGVAHDYNNMLGVVLGHTELAMMKVSSESPVYDDLRQIKKAANRSADLTRQLLGFARRQTTRPRVLDLNQTISGMLDMLRRLIGENITLEWRPGGSLEPVMIDPSQIDQILANLCINARDAIDRFGTITLTTENSELGGLRRPLIGDDAMPGRYVLLTVSDNGSGMDEAILEKVFEPFFTTKEFGLGTGLGLATVYGIVKQNNGYIKVDSRLGKGSSFRIYLPATAGKVVGRETTDGEEVAEGTETIMLVEDEMSVLRLGKTILSRFGYTVLSADSPAKAIEKAGQHSGSIDMLVTDVVMPEMDGKALKTCIERLHPGIKTLFMSGHTSDVFMDKEWRVAGFNFIQKPFSLYSLARKVREILDEPPVLERDRR